MLSNFFSVACSSTKNISQYVIAHNNSVVQACLDSTKQYHQVSTIKSRTSYLEKAYDYQPITAKKGFVAWDFNEDKKLDYIFIEKQQKQTFKKNQTIAKVRLVICASQGSQNSAQYKRILPNFTLYESILPDFQAEAHKIRVHKSDLIISRSYHEHNWGSDQVLNFYQYDIKHSDFKLVNQEILSNSGDGYRNDTQETYDYQNRRYTKKQTCGQFVGPCQSGVKKGSFKVKSIYLSNSFDIFQAQISSKNLN